MTAQKKRALSALRGLGGKGLSGAGWSREQTRIPQPSVEVTQNVTGNGHIF